MVFPLEQFRLLYPMFAAVPDATVLAWAEQARCMLADQNCGCEDSAWMLLVAHMLALNGFLGGNQGPGAIGNIASATIDKVSVSFAQNPGAKDSWSFWLASTPWGKQLAAQLARCRAGATGYVGGLPERSAFRSVGGIFPNGGRAGFRR